MGKDTVAGKVQKVGGEVRSAIADVTNDKEGKARGEADAAKGAVRENIGKVKDALK